MAKESKFIEVAPASVDSTVEKWGWFGWELMGQPQEIYNKTVRDGNSRVDSNGNRTTEVITETTHYFRVSFQRETSMPNYNELCKLEQEYDNPPSPPYLPEPPKRFGCLFSIIGVILAIVGGLMLYGGFFSLVQSDGIGEKITGLLIGLGISSIPIAGLVLIIRWRLKKYSKTMPEWNVKYEERKKRIKEIDDRQAEIVNQAKSLLR